MLWELRVEVSWLILDILQVMSCLWACTLGVVVLVPVPSYRISFSDVFGIQGGLRRFKRCWCFHRLKRTFDFNWSSTHRHGSGKRLKCLFSHSLIVCFCWHSPFISFAGFLMINLTWSFIIFELQLSVGICMQNTNLEVKRAFFTNAIDFNLQFKTKEVKHKIINLRMKPWHPWEWIRLCPCRTRRQHWWRQETSSWLRLLAPCWRVVIYSCHFEETRTCPIQWSQGGEWNRHSYFAFRSLHLHRLFGVSKTYQQGGSPHISCCWRPASKDI